MLSLSESREELHLCFLVYIFPELILIEKTPSFPALVWLKLLLKYFVLKKLNRMSGKGKELYLNKI